MSGVERLCFVLRRRRRRRDTTPSLWPPGPVPSRSSILSPSPPLPPSHRKYSYVLPRLPCASNPGAASYVPISTTHQRHRDHHIHTRNTRRDASSHSTSHARSPPGRPATSDLRAPGLPGPQPCANRVPTAALVPSSVIRVRPAPLAPSTTRPLRAGRGSAKFHAVRVAPASRREAHWIETQTVLVGSSTPSAPSCDPAPAGCFSPPSLLTRPRPDTLFIPFPFSRLPSARPSWQAILVRPSLHTRCWFRSLLWAVDDSIILSDPSSVLSLHTTTTTSTRRVIGRRRQAHRASPVDIRRAITSGHGHGSDFVLAGSQRTLPVPSPVDNLITH